MGPQRDDKVVDAVGGEVRGQDDGFVLPAVLLRRPVGAVLADLWREYTQAGLGSGPTAMQQGAYMEFSKKN